MLTSTCITGDLTPYTPSLSKPWDKVRAQHLYRRIGFGATPDELDAALALDPAALVDQLIDEAINLPDLPRPEWADWKGSQFRDLDDNIQKLYEYLIDWSVALPQRGLREKLTLFWSGHFVTQFESYTCSVMGYRYLEILRDHALGNFRTMTEAIGKTPAMLFYLNGADNTREAPNENYARELFELFTLGRDNGYTQQDIVETSRALTGWTIAYDQATAQEGDWCTKDEQFYPYRFDNGVKTIFGQTGNWGYDDVHDILFSQRSQKIATYICGLLYQEFVSHKIDTVIVGQLANTFLSNNFEIAPVLRQLFKSEHFFDDGVIHTQVKNPYFITSSLLKEMGMPIDQAIKGYVFGAPEIMGQVILNPPDVAGWPGDRDWINTTTLTMRWEIVQGFTAYYADKYALQLVNFAKKVSGNSNDAAAVTQALVDFFIPRGLQTPEAYERATKVFQGEIPQNYFDDGTWSLDFDGAQWQIFLLMQHIARLPEFQLV
ncbi:MAG: DUF1800 domain-containing protein [Bacteroidota bacterium]